MPFYEHVFIARQDVSAQSVEELSGKLSEIIEQGGGKVTKTEPWGLRTLAYKIKKNRKGHYVLLNIDAPHEAMAEMERHLRLNDDVLRHMTIRVDELEEGPSAMMRAKAHRDSRGPRPNHGRPDDRAGARAPRPKGTEEVSSDTKAAEHKESK
ncbi:MAG: 30S ribosomal protein S6 [Sphingomonadales bacterium]